MTAPVFHDRRLNGMAFFAQLPAARPAALSPSADSSSSSAPNAQSVTVKHGFGPQSVEEVEAFRAAIRAKESEQERQMRAQIAQKSKVSGVFDQIEESVADEKLAQVVGRLGDFSLQSPNYKALELPPAALSPAAVADPHMTPNRPTRPYVQPTVPMDI